MIDAEKMEDALMFGQAEIENWRKQFERDWQGTKQATLIKGLYGRLTDEVKEDLKQTDPAGFAEFNKYMEKKR